MSMTSPGRPQGVTSEVGIEVRLDIPVAAHRGSYQDYLGRLQHAARKAAQGEDEEEYPPNLFAWAVDTRNLRCAWDFLKTHGGRAPGIDGLTYDDIPPGEVWRLLRELHKALLDGQYEPLSVLERHIDKGGNRGTRLLHLPAIFDRVVGRAIAQAIDPYIDPKLDDCAYGWRTGRNRLHALARAKAVAEENNRWVWVSQDIRNAFPNVPRGRLRDVLRLRINNKDLVNLIMKLADNGLPRGIPMGQSICPLLMNLYRDHFLDRCWRKQHTDIPLLTAGDDLLALCLDLEEANTAHVTLQHLLEPAGLPLKYSPEQAIRNLDAGQSVTWLGFSLEKRDKQLQVRIAPPTWEKLESRLIRLHTEPNTPLLAKNGIRNRLRQLGPTFPHEDVDKVLSRVESLCHQYSFDELPGLDQLRREWEKGYAQWQAIAAGQKARQSAHAGGSAPRTRFLKQVGTGAGETRCESPVPTTALQPVTLYVDGSCDTSSRIGGWAYIVETSQGSLERSGACRDTTNNRMELVAVVNGLQAIDPSHVLIVTDSQYVQRGMTQYLARWHDQGWQAGPPHQRRPLVNADLWQAIHDLVPRHRRVECAWVRGHSGHPGNERADRLARNAAHGQMQEN